MEYIFLFLSALVLTIVIETGVLFFLVRGPMATSPRRLPDTLLIFSGVFASGATLPYVWFVLPNLVGGRLVYVALAETFAVGAEALFYAMALRLPIRSSFILSLICNLASFSLGALLFPIL